MDRSAVALIGAEFEENLSLRYLAAAARKGGFSPHILPCNGPDAIPEIVRAIVAERAIVVGISVPFQLRARELLGIGEALREAGFSGHICAGGHFATFEYDNILREFPAVDSICRHEGEDTFAELCARVREAGRDASLVDIAGLVVRTAEQASTAGPSGVVDKQREAGRVYLTFNHKPPPVHAGKKRPLPHLDTLAFPERPPECQEVLGVPCAPLVGSRGCYADCSFCCIYAYAENADGARYRMRSPDNIVAEMSREYHERGVRLFVFHDDNFFVPSRSKNLARYERMARLMRRAGLVDIALVIKCRPNDVDAELFAMLQQMGMIRAYIGIETNSDEGVVSLNRRITSEDNARALHILRELDVYCSFNVLLFDPEATLEGIGKNLDFMETFADSPWNFCRAEVYAGTPLKQILEREGRLRGDYLAWTYEMRDPRVELLFRIATTAFAARNFKPDGVSNLNMGIRFDSEVLRRFYPGCWDPAWHAQLVDTSLEIGRDSVGKMRRALAFVMTPESHDAAATKRFTLQLAREISRDDFRFTCTIKALRHEMESRIRRSGGPIIALRHAPGAPVWAAESARLSSSTGSELSTEMLPLPAISSPSTMQ